MNDDAYRRLKADQEPLLPGLAYAGAAAVGGSILVNRIRSVPVKILTPLALGAVVGSYFLPAHADLLKNTWTPMRISKTGAPIDASDSTLLPDLKRSTNDAAFELGNKTVETVDDVSRQAQASWEDIKRKGENLADAYREAGKDQAHRVVDESVQGAKSWLNQQKNEADRLLDETASVLSASTSSFPSSRRGQSEDTNRFHDIDRSSSAAPSQLAKETAFFKEKSQEQPSSSRWSWWSKSNSVSPPKAQDTETDMVTDGFANVKPVPKRRERSSPSLNLNDGEHVVENLPGKPRKIVVDKAVASAAIKGHDNVVNREALHGRNAEETARKVHENVIDATVPRHRQGRNEIHKLEVSRQASESDMRDGKFVVRELRSQDEVPQRVRRGSAIKKDISHGLQNLEKRAHMLYDGVEHLEHSINKRVQKSLEEEAEFWHQQSLKEEANARAGERAM
ncbi:hypothetical protein BGZ75_005887 [Mortierella antarctica]|nr:hypothetical protein BGZ75_005887 [Mortierella antarctica]